MANENEITAWKPKGLSRITATPFGDYFVLCNAFVASMCESVFCSSGPIVWSALAFNIRMTIVQTFTPGPVEDSYIIETSVALAQGFSNDVHIRLKHSALACRRSASDNA